jgi:hemoglobin
MHAGRVRVSKPTLFEALGGAAGVLRLAHAWHERVLADEIVAHAFSHGFHPKHTERLAAYWAEAWGGPAHFSQRLGSESSVVRMHSGNGPHHEMDQRAIECFDRAMDDVAVSDPALRRALHDYFAWTATVTMAAHPDDKRGVPGDLRIPRWSWDGLQK